METSFAKHFQILHTRLAGFPYRGRASQTPIGMPYEVTSKGETGVPLFNFRWPVGCAANSVGPSVQRFRTARRRLAAANRHAMGSNIWPGFDSQFRRRHASALQPVVGELGARQKR